jgi:hypothetical protein
MLLQVRTLILDIGKEYGGNELVALPNANQGEWTTRTGHNPFHPQPNLTSVAYIRLIYRFYFDSCFLAFRVRYGEF